MGWSAAIWQGEPGALGHHSTTQKQQSGPKPGPRSEPARTKRPRTERQDDVGESVFSFYWSIISAHVILKDKFLGRDADTCLRGHLETKMTESLVGRKGPVMTLPPVATSWDSCTHIWKMVSVAQWHFATLTYIYRIRIRIMLLPILQVTFTLIQTKAAPVMQWRYIVTLQEEDQPVLILFTLRYFIFAIQIIRRPLGIIEVFKKKTHMDFILTWAFSQMN